MSNYISVAICFNNPPKSIFKVIESIRPLVDRGITNQVILADNASLRSQSTSIFAYAQEILETNPNYQIVTNLFIEIPGVAHARRAAVMASINRFLLFLDDDTPLIDSNLDRLAFYSDLKCVGAVSTTGIPFFSNGELPAWFPEYEKSYACGIPSTRNYIWTAGLLVNSALLRQIYGKGVSHVFIGRGNDSRNGSLSSYEDYEYYIWFLAIGFGMVADPLVSYSHHIPLHKLTEKYRSELNASIHKAHSFARYYKSLAILYCHIVYPLSRIFGLRLLLSSIRKAVQVLPSSPLTLMMSNVATLNSIKHSDAIHDL